MTRTRELSSRTLRMRGLVAVALAVGVATVLVVKPFAGDDGMTEFFISAPEVPDGIRDGVPVDVRGETIGSVCGLDISRPDATRVGLCVKSTAMGEITDDAAVSFVSRNLFGSDALRLTPTGVGSPITSGGEITLAQPPSDYTITATVRSAGAFTLPVLTPELNDLLGQVSDTTIRLAPFLTAATVGLQTMDRGDVQKLTAMLPQAADAFDGVGEAGSGAVTALVTVLTNPLLADQGYTARVSSMIGDIGGLFSDLGALFNNMSGLGPALDLVTAFTTPLTVALRDVTPAQVNSMINALGGAFHTDPATGKTVLSVQVNLDVVPSVATGLGLMLSKGVK